MKNLIVVIGVLTVCCVNNALGFDFGKRATSFGIKEEGFVAMMIRKLKGLFRISWGNYANTLYPLRSRNNLWKNDSGFDKP